MSAPDLSFVPPHILPQLAKIRPYILLVLTKGANYDHPDTRKIIQSEHLPYTFAQRDRGVLVLTMPVNDDTRVAAIGIYAGLSKEEVIQLTENDPAVKAGIFTYEVVNAMGMQGDVLP
jgi:uncharacterized protein YciI